MSKKKLFLIPLFLIPLILVSLWFRNGLIHGGGEEGILYYNTQKNFLLSTTVWAEFVTGLFTPSWLQRSPVMYLSNVFHQIGIPPVLFQATLFYILMLTGMLSVYFLTLNLLDQHKEKFQISLLSALFYLFNPYSFSQVWGRGLSAQYNAFALLPLSLLLFHLGLKRKQYIFGLLIALISTMMAMAYEWITFIVLYHLVLLIYFAYHVITSKEKLREFLHSMTFILFVFLVWSLFNAWWLIPLFVSADSVYSVNIAAVEENLGTLIGVSRNYTPDILIRLLQRTYFFDPSAFSTVYSSFAFALISMLAPVFLLIGLINVIRNSNLGFKFFVVLLTLGLVVSLGANPPFGFVFVWLFKIFTPLQAFRNPFEKIGLVLILGYSPIFAYGLVSFFAGWKYKRVAIAAVIILICGIFAWPMWTGRVIAGPDKKIGLDIPPYYQDLRNFLKNKGDDFRLLMTPIWSGDGAFYQWGNGGRYQGSDPMVFMLDQPVISNGARGPYFYDFIANIRKYMERVNVAPAFKLLRTKFLIDRKDAIMITDKEKDHYKYLTSAILLPHQLEIDLQTICGNILSKEKTDGIVGIICQIPPAQENFSNIRYLHLKVKTDVSANLEIALRDIKDVRIRWYVRGPDTEYQTGNDWTLVSIPLSAPTEPNSEIDFSQIRILEILGHPKDAPDDLVREINLAEVKLDPGLEKKTDEFKKVADFGQLQVFEAREFNAPPEFGTLSSSFEVSDFVSLFDMVNKRRNLLGETAFVLTSQNANKDLRSIPKTTQIQIADKSKISNTRYWLNVNEATGAGLLVLSKTFYPEWKVIPGIAKEKISGNFFDDIRLLTMLTVPEDNHFVVNGYANLWKIDGREKEFAIIFKPEIVADISAKISLFSILLAIGLYAMKFITRPNR